MFGPELGFCTSAEMKAEGQTGNIKELINPFNLALGLQFVFFVTDNLGIDLKADYGLTKTAKKNTFAGMSFQDGGHNVSLQIGISYTFGR